MQEKREETKAHAEPHKFLTITGCLCRLDLSIRVENKVEQELSRKKVKGKNEGNGKLHSPFLLD